jgi:tRNA-guanine family transglycosylase
MPNYVRSSIIIRGKVLPRPAFIPSISGASESISYISEPDVLFESLKETDFSSTMISVYDLIVKDALFAKYGARCFTWRYDLHAAFNLPKTIAIFLDSGAYELHMLNAKLSDWFSADQVYYYQRMLRPDVMVILDKATSYGETQQERIKLIQENHDVAKRICKAKITSTPLMAVAHGYDFASLYSAVKELCSISELDFIGVSHKEFSGLTDDKIIDFLYESARLTKGSGKFFHILGAGDISLWPYYVAIGADSFDSTQWIDKVATYKSFHWEERDAKNLSVECACEKCRETKKMLNETSSNDKLRLPHNLYCIKEALNLLQEGWERGTLAEIARKADSSLFDKLSKSPALIGKIFRDSDGGQPGS